MVDVGGKLKRNPVRLHIYTHRTPKTFKRYLDIIETDRNIYIVCLTLSYKVKENG